MHNNQKIANIIELVVNLAWLDSQANDLTVAARYSEEPEARARFCAAAAAEESDRIDNLLAAEPSLLTKAIEWYADRLIRIEAQYDLELTAHLERYDLGSSHSGFCLKEEARWAAVNEWYATRHDQLSATKATLEAYAATIIK